MSESACDSLLCKSDIPLFYGKTISLMNSSPVFKQMVASCTGSIVTTVCLNPINVIKVHLQRMGSQTNLLSTCRSIMEKAGVRGFWGGTSSGLVMSVPNTVLYMTTYEALKARFNQTAASNSQKLFNTAAAGFLARVVAVSAISPLELVRTLQSSGRAQSILSIARLVVAERGLGGLYRGWLPTILRDCPYSAIYWFTFDFVRPLYSNICDRYLQVTRLKEMEEKGRYRALATFFSGASSGMMAALFTHPFDVLKTKRQLAILPSDGQQLMKQISLKKIFWEEGCAGVFRGLSMRLLSVMPASAIMITVYEAVKALDLS
eukprot:gene3381-3706_t